MRLVIAIKDGPNQRELSWEVGDLGSWDDETIWKRWVQPTLFELKSYVKDHAKDHA